MILVKCSQFDEEFHQNRMGIKKPWLIFVLVIAAKSSFSSGERFDFLVVFSQIPLL